jgi:hypothetical protein
MDSSNSARKAANGLDKRDSRLVANEWHLSFWVEPLGEPMKLGRIRKLVQHAYRGKAQSCRITPLIFR